MGAGSWVPLRWGGFLLKWAAGGVKLISSLFLITREQLMGLGFVIATTQQMPQVVINDQTLTTLGTVFIVLSPLAVAFWWITRKLNKIDNRLADIEDGQAETWCAYQQEAWVLRLVNMNQELGLKVPDVDAASLVATARRRRREMDDNES